jgi:hypothetical protein
MNELRTRIFGGRGFQYLILFVLFLIEHAYLFWYYGLRALFDSEGYIAAADFLLQTGNLQDIRQNFYFAHIGLIAICRYFFPGEIIPFLLLQCVISFLALIALYRAAEKVYNSRIAGLSAALIYLLWIDHIQWNTVAMTESLMQSMICFLLYIITHFKTSVRDFFLILLMSVLLVLIRPTGILLVVASCIFLMAYYRNSAKPVLKIVIGIAFAAVSCLGAYYMFTHWDFTRQLNVGNIVTYMDVIKGNPLYSETMRMDTTNLKIPENDKHPLEKMAYFVVNNPVHFVKAGILKIFYLLAGVRPYYSVTHNLFLITWFTFIYILFFVGWRSNSVFPIKMFVLSAVVVNCILIGIGTVDWDNRFYIPMAPGIVLLAGGGAAFLFSRLQNRIERG